MDASSLQWFLCNFLSLYYCQRIQVLHLCFPNCEFYTVLYVQMCVYILHCKIYEGSIIYFTWYLNLSAANRQKGRNEHIFKSYKNMVKVRMSDVIFRSQRASKASFSLSLYTQRGFEGGFAPHSQSRIQADQSLLKVNNNHFKTPLWKQGTSFTSTFHIEISHITQPNLETVK